MYSLSRIKKSVAANVPNTGMLLIVLDRRSQEFLNIKEKMDSTIVKHRQNGRVGGVFSKYEIIKIESVWNLKLYGRYKRRQMQVTKENGGSPTECQLFHGTPRENISDITQNGFDERKAKKGGMFGQAIYFAEHSSKANQYVYGIGGGTGCNAHKSNSCYICERKMLLCQVTLGNAFFKRRACQGPPSGFHSIVGLPELGGLWYKEYAIYRGDQALPEFIITYKIVR